MTNNISIAIAIVDDHTLFRQGLNSLLSEYSEINIVLEAAHGAEMKERIVQHPTPDVVLLALSTFEDDKPIINMLKSGAGGYLLKESRIAEVVKAITVIHEQGYFLNELISAKMLRNIQDDGTFRDSATPLSKNEITFLRLCCSELTYKEIANEMTLSPHTIDNYRQELFEKLEIKSRTGLVLYAIKQEIFVP
jgi:DNA-binding NarL/FixJ family response regulator